MFSYMKKRLLVPLTLFMSFFSNANSEVRITEIMTNNVSTIVSERYNYDGYVELYNDGDNIDLKGWTVSNEKEGKPNWSVVLDSSHVLPKGYSLLFFGDKESSSVSAKNVQNNYVGSVGEKLTTDAGSLIFSNGNKTLKISYPKQYPHIAYCEDGFMVPTPGKENDGLNTKISNRAASPTFKDNKPGYYNDILTVELDCKTEGALIYYTINGDIPSADNGMVYSGPISIDSSTVVRARAYKEGMLFSEILTGSYILPNKYYTDSQCKGSGERLPIVSISVNNIDMFDSTLGMYVKGKNGVVGGCYSEPYNFYQDWMRSANFEYILDGKVVDNQEVEIGVYGGCTRIHNAKSLKIKANKRSGNNKMQYDNFFPLRDYKKYKSLALRNGGNGYAYVQPRWRDMFIQSLADGMNVDKQMAQPVSYYINGTFWGMMILTERTNEDYVYHNYGLDEDEIDFLSLGAGYECDAGTKDFYNNMIDYVKTNYSKEEFYDKLNEMMDIDEYIDYQIIEQYVGNTDWVSNNTKLWRKRDGGRFRWILFDTDFGLSKATSVDKDMIKFATSEKGYEACWVLLRSCLKNEDFRWKFLDQYLDRIDNQFTDKIIDTKLDSIWDLTRLDMCATMKNSKLLGAPGNIDTFNYYVENMRRFAKERKPYVIAQLKKEFGLSDDTATIKIRPVFPNSETPEFKFLFNKREITSSKYNTWRYVGERVKIEPIVPPGYRIRNWAINNKTVKNDNGKNFVGGALAAVADSSELKFSIYFEEDPDYVVPTEIYLNEICASNSSYVDDNGEASDWIEIYNGGATDVDLAGVTVRNETKQLEITIPGGSVETIAPSHGYVILWADKAPENGPLHLNFKLGASASEKIKLTYPYKGGEVVLDSMTYELHGIDESYGREGDGLSKTTVFDKCIDESGYEFSTSTPLAANGSLICESSSVKQWKRVDSGSTVYVSGQTIFLKNIDSSCQVEVISPSGVVVAKKMTNAGEGEIIVPASGMYIVRIGTEYWKVIAE